MSFVTGGLFQGENGIRRRPKIDPKILLKRLFQGKSKVAVGCRKSRSLQESLEQVEERLEQVEGRR